MDISKKLTKTALATLAAAVTLLPATQLLADGTLGNTSTDSIQVKILKSDSVRISAMEDVLFDSTSSMLLDTAKQEDFCVFASSGNYKMTASTAFEAGGIFQMTNGANKLDYQISLTALGLGVPDVSSPMTSGVAVTGLPGNTLSESCLNIPNAIISVNIKATDFNAAAPGQYTDTLTMLVEPE